MAYLPADFTDEFTAFDRGYAPVKAVTTPRSIVQ